MIKAMILEGLFILVWFCILKFYFADTARALEAKMLNKYPTWILVYTIFTILVALALFVTLVIFIITY